MALGTLPLMAGPSVLPLRMIALTAGTMGLKGVVFPWLLLRALRQAEVRREVEPFVGYIWSVVVGLVRWPFRSGWARGCRCRAPAHPTLAVPVALFMIFVGLFVIISRRTALSQVLGYIVLENGIYAFGMVIAGRSAGAGGAGRAAGRLRRGVRHGHRDLPHQPRVRPHRRGPVGHA